MGGATLQQEMECGAILRPEGDRVEKIRGARGSRRDGRRDPRRRFPTKKAMAG
jgi:hypothetical protein